jgi:hypothetical protein
MKGNVFQCHGENINKQQFLKTAGVLEELINKTFEYPQDVASICKTFSIVALVQPDNLTTEEYTKDMGNKMIWETKMKTYTKRMDMLKSNQRGIYAIVWGQCSPMMQSKLEPLDDYKSKSNGCDCIWILKEIRGITHRFEGTPNIFISLGDAWSNYYGYKQSNDQTLHEYLKDFQSLVQVLEHYGAVMGTVGPYIDSVKEAVKALAPAGISATDLLTRAVAAAKQKSIAIAFLKRADRRRYGGLWSELGNNYSRGQDHYPTDLTNAYNLLLNYQAPTQPRQGRREQPSTDEGISGVTFQQNAAPVQGNYGVTHAQIKCFTCNDYGQYASTCPNAAPKKVQILQTADTAGPTDYHSEFSFVHIASGAFMFVQAGNRQTDIIPPTWILLSSQLTVSVFKNRSLLTNIRPSSTTRRVHTNGGTQVSCQMGTIRNFGDVWFNTKSLANILPMAEVRKVCRITMDTSVEALMDVRRRDGSIMKFREYKSGLYYYDTGQPTAPDNHSSSPTNNLFLNTVAANKATYTRREIEGADKARALYKKIGRPSEQEFSKILNNNLIRNCPVTPEDAKRALIIYGPKEKQ